jgi:hypothetical protein
MGNTSHSINPWRGFMDDKIVPIENGKKDDAETLLRISRDISRIMDIEARDKLRAAWKRAAATTLFFDPFVPS